MLYKLAAKFCQTLKKHPIPGLLFELFHKADLETAKSLYGDSITDT